MKNVHQVHCKPQYTRLEIQTKKDDLKRKGREVTGRQKETLSEATRKWGIVTTPRMPYIKAPESTKEESLNINICVAHAHQKNTEKPRSHVEKLNQMLPAHNFPILIIPDLPNSQQTLGRETEQDNRDTNIQETKPRSYNEKGLHW